MVEQEQEQEQEQQLEEGVLESSSVDSSTSDSPVPFNPVSTEVNAREGQSLARRFSSAATSFLTGKSNSGTNDNDSDSDSENENETGVNDIDTENYQEGLYATNELSRALTTTVPDQEESPESIEQTKKEETLRDSSGSSDNAIQEHVLRRKSSIASTIEKVRKYGFWDKDFKNDRSHIAWQILINYVFLIVGFAGILCIYTGSYYQRSTRFKNLKMAVIVADQNMGELPNIMGQTVEYYFTNITSVQAAGDFHIWNYTKIADVAAKHNNTITEEVYRQIHHQKFWAAFYVHENATLDWYEALVTQSQTFDPAQSLMEVVYETGRDYNTVVNYITSIVNQLFIGYNEFIPQSGLVGNMLKTLNSTQAIGVLNNAPQLVTTIPTFRVHDLHPVPNALFSATMQLGGVYIIVMTFFLQVFTLRINLYLASKLTGAQFLVAKIISTQFAYFFISLAFIVLNTAFQVPFNVAFGNSGFLVIWMFAFLLMSSIGSIIEVMVMVAFALKQALLGFVLVYVVVLNLTPVLSPIVLCPSFYRYGYAMPLKNFYDLLQVAYFNAWKGHMGRNIGILVAWIIITNTTLPFAMKWLANQKKKGNVNVP